MAIGDTVSAHSTINDTIALSIRPTGTAEWIIFNFYFGGSWELYRTDGTHDVLIDFGSGSGSIQQRKMIASNGIYFKIKNVSGGAAYFGYDGVVKKV